MCLHSRLELNSNVKFSRFYATESAGADSTTNYAPSGELFGFLPLGTVLSEDTAQGRILLQNVTNLLIACTADSSPAKVSSHFPATHLVIVGVFYSGLSHRSV